MFRRQQITISLGFLLVMALACRLTLSEERPFENESFTFTIPAGWQTMEEIWDRPAAIEQEHKGLGVNELILIQYPPEQGKGEAFFAVSSSPLANEQDLESRFTQAYQGLAPEIEDVSQQSFELGELSGYEISYRRPWGEPWWQFRDVWLEKDAVVYVLSFYASPDSFETYADPFDQILESFQFED